MSKPITSFVGLDAHADSIAIGIAPSGRQEPHFVGMSMIVLFDGAPSRLFEGIPSSHSHTL